MRHGVEGRNRMSNAGFIQVARSGKLFREPFITDRRLQFAGAAG